jgi:cold shock CspA family protein
MAKSKETYSKKEKEKKKLKKRLAKEEKKEARKLNSTKGQELEEMIAYVDENGNITDSPPDLSNKKEINHELIPIGVARQCDEEPELVRTGKVTFFNEIKGFGFIKDQKSNEDVFVHLNGLKTPVRENDLVSFEIQMTPKGASAVEVKKI